MDDVINAHCHKINNNNIIEYSAPLPSKVKYTPPSPTTSGYSESGSEVDNQDSGRVSEMENSPKLHPKRPNTISLSMGMFNTGEGQMNSPDPFPEGKSTIRMNENAELSRQKNSEGAFKQANPNDASTGDMVLVSGAMLKTLLLSLHDARTRLDTVETKVDVLVKAIQLQHKTSNSALLKLSRTILALGNDRNRHSPENGRITASKFHCRPIEQNVPSFQPQVPISCNNNNLSHSECSTTKGRKFQSSECVSSNQTMHIPSKLSPSHSDYATATFPRFLRSDAASRSPLSVAPPAGNEIEKYDNVDAEKSGAKTYLNAHDRLESEWRKSDYVNDDVIRASLCGENIPEQAILQGSPVYAVVKKKSRSTDQLQAPPLPRKSRDSVTSSNNDINRQKGPSEKDLDDLIKEMTDNHPEESKQESPVGTLNRTSRFSDVESMMSALQNTALFSDNHSGDNVHYTTWGEEYENRPSKANSVENPTKYAFAGDVLHSSDRKDDITLGNRSSGRTNFNADIDNRAGIPQYVAKNEPTWHDLQHDLTYSNESYANNTNALPGRGKMLLLQQTQSADCLVAASNKSISSLHSENSSQKVKKGRKKQDSSKDSDSKKQNVLVANYNKIFKRKGKKAKRSVSQSSFTFVNSPLYETENQNCLANDSPRVVKRGASVDSFLNEEKSPDFTVVSSLSNFSLKESDISTNSQTDDESLSSGKRKSSRSLTSQNLANTQLLRLQSREESQDGDLYQNERDFDDNISGEFYDNNSVDGENDEMGSNLVKMAKRAFRSSPKLYKASRTPNGSLPNFEDKPLLSFKQLNDQSDSPKILTSNVNGYTNPEHLSEGADFADDVFIPPGVILDRQQREQADRIRFETDGQTSHDEPPPKPNRPGFSHGGLQGSPRSSINAHGSSNGAVPGYPRGMPAVPPKQKIMTTEELTKHEAQEKLRMKERDDAMLQQRLDQQQRQARENAKWLQQEEQMLNPENASANGEDSALGRGRGSNTSLTEMAPPPPSVAPSKPPRKGSRPKDEPSGPPQTKIQLEEVKTAPTMQLNRDEDDVYKHTMEVVKAVLGMNNMTMNAKPDELFASVKTVGAALKQLCTSLEKALPELPEDFHREIDMAQKTTNKDLSQVINQLKLVQRFFATTQVVEYKKCLMAANQVLAIDAKNLLDVVDRARIRKIQTAQEREARAKAQAEGDVRHGAAVQSPTGYEPEELYPDGEFL